jgi:hypothetical protein
VLYTHVNERRGSMGRRYRVCEYVEDDNTRLGLCEVITTDTGLTTCLKVASTEVFVTVDDLKQALERMRAACELPLLKIASQPPRGDDTVTSNGLVEQLADETVRSS